MKNSPQLINKQDFSGKPSLQSLSLKVDATKHSVHRRFRWKEVRDKMWKLFHHSVL